MRRLDPSEAHRLERRAVDAETLAAASEIVAAVHSEGEEAARRYGEQFGEISKGGELLIPRSELDAAFENLPRSEQGLLQRTGERIGAFARAQREALAEVTVEIPGGRAGHGVSPVDRAGCYAPGGRYPLPSSVLMTAVTARVAGVANIVVASPRPSAVTLAAASVAGAASLLALGGAHAIAVLAYGIEGVEPCDVVVGPGNRWVTAAKHLVSAAVGIDMLAGPSELVVLADDTSDPATVAADLLAQAEHDPEALPVLITTSRHVADEVDAEIDRQLADLPTRTIAEPALETGFAVIVSGIDDAVELCDRLAPEHLQVMTKNAREVASRLGNWGGLFVGGGSAEVLGDYGAGPNHTLPTGGVARHRGGLSVLDFMRVRTWLEIDDPGGARQTTEDAVALARLEGLEAHARAAERRLR